MGVSAQVCMCAKRGREGGGGGRQTDGQTDGQTDKDVVIKPVLVSLYQV